MKKIVILIALFMALALGLSVLGSFGNTPGSWFDTDTNVEHQRNEISGIWRLDFSEFAFPEEEISQDVRFTVPFVGLESFEPGVYYGSGVRIGSESDPALAVTIHSYEDSYGSEVFEEPGAFDLFDGFGEVMPTFIIDFGTTPQQVSEQFYNWFEANFQKESYSMLKAGTYGIFDSVTPFEGLGFESLEFCWTQYDILDEFPTVVRCSGFNFSSEEYLGAPDLSCVVYETVYESSVSKVSAILPVYRDGVALTELGACGPRTITIEKDTLVTTTFYNWFVANAAPYAEEEPEQPTYPEGYLFYEETLTEEHRYDLPVLVEGVTYTAFVEESVRIFTYTAVDVFSDGYYYIIGEGVDPMYNPSDGSWRMEGGTYVVSIRIGSESEPEEPTEEWLFKDEYIIAGNDNVRGDLPLPVDGVTYTVYLDGEKLGTVISNNGGFYFEFDGGYLGLFFDSHEYYTDYSGSYSLRVGGEFTPEGYLFYEEVITEGSYYNFPAPVEGVTYTLVVNGEDWRTNVYDGSDWFRFGGEEYKFDYVASENRYFASLRGGVYSLRIDSDPAAS